MRLHWNNYKNSYDKSKHSHLWFHFYITCCEIFCNISPWSFHKIYTYLIRELFGVNAQGVLIKPAKYSTTFNFEVKWIFYKLSALHATSHCAHV